MPDEASAQRDPAPPLLAARLVARRTQPVARPGMLVLVARLIRDYRPLLRGFYSIILALASGFALAAAIGIAVGSLMALSRTLREHLEPLINALYATPLIALSPILILALGIGPASKVAIVFLMAVFPILINTAAGIL